MAEAHSPWQVAKQVVRAAGEAFSFSHGFSLFARGRGRGTTLGTRGHEAGGGGGDR